MAYYEHVKVLEYRDGEDPKKVVQDAFGSLDKWDVYRNNVLVATAPVKIGLILRSDRSLDEERWQAKVGLILKLGEKAFRDTEIWPDTGSIPSVGDWVFFRAGESDECGINGISARIVKDDKIVGRVPDPLVLR